MGCVHRRKRAEEERKREMEEMREGERRKERKRKRKRERGRRPTVSVHWCSDSRNSLDQGGKFGDLTRGYASRSRDSPYFGLFIAFGLLFWNRVVPC